MLFNSYEFLFLFLPVVLIGYYGFLRNRQRLIFLTLMSYIFYGWWDYRFCALMLASTVIDYVSGFLIFRAPDTRRRRLWIVVSVMANLSLLGFFKYFDLGARTLNMMASLFGASSPLVSLLHITLPVGISFYTFQSMSYSIDIYRGVVKPARSFADFACYVSLFPQLVAGPIIRYKELADQLVVRTHTLQKFSLGITFFILGLAKKVILADGVAPFVEIVFGLEAPGLLASWVGILSYAMQIYFDFSGYSDMAVGLGLLLGFEFPQNFNSPYKSVSISDFWRRWHMSLSTWLRDYLYISLGGNRIGSVRTYVNLFITMLLGGLWHGANWTFVAWGAYHAVLLAIERASGRKSLVGWAPVFLQRALAFLLVLGGWVLFRSQSLEQVGAMYAGLVGLNGLGGSFAATLKAAPLSCLMLIVTMGMAWMSPNTWEIRWRPGFWLALALAILFVVCVGVILVNSSSPFLYFQF